MIKNGLVTYQIVLSQNLYFLYLGLKYNHFQVPDVVCQKLLKNAKSNSEIVKIWWFLWRAKSGIPILDRYNHDTYLVSWLYLSRVGIPDLALHKNRQIFTISLLLLAFLSNFWQTTAGSSPKHDILTRWQKHVWIHFTVFQFLGNCGAGQAVEQCKSKSVSMDSFPTRKNGST